MKRIILDLCGGSGSWSKPYVEAGYDVRLITLPDDVRLWQFTEQVHGILAAPPCTVFCRSGQRWKRSEEDKLAALSVVDACLRFVQVCKPHWWALENPVGTLWRWLGKPVFYFDPCDFGDAYTKKTCLWGNFNPPKKTPVVPILKDHIANLPPTKDRAAIRGITPLGFAKAFFEANP